MNVPELLNPFSREDVLASGPFVVEVTLEDGPLQSVGFDLRRGENSVYWDNVDHRHSQPLKGDLRVQGDRLLFTRVDDVDFVLRPFVPGDGHLVHLDDSEYLEQAPPGGQQALLKALNAAWLADRDAPTAPGADETGLVLALSADSQPINLLRLSGTAFPLQRVDGAWRRLSPDVEDEAFGASDVDVLPDAIVAWDEGRLDDALASSTDAYGTGSPFERLFIVTAPDENDDEGVVSLFAERSRGRLYKRADRRWSLVDRREETLSPTLDVTTGAISAWDDGSLSNLTAAEQFDMDGDTP